MMIGIQHICRLIGTFTSLQEGNLFSTIMSDFCNGFGYSWNIFYSPLTAYLPLIFKLITSSFVLSLKLFMFLTVVLSGVFMYKLVHKISNNNISAIFSAIIYIIAPYHLTDLYSRIALAEVTSFVFLPLVFLGIYNLVHEEKNMYYLSLGAIGLILTHNVITLYTAIFCLIYLIINYKKLSRKVISNVLIHIILILLCTSFYWIPLLEHYFATTYEVFIPNRMYSNSTIIGSKLSILDLFITKPWGMNFHIGIPIICGIILFIFYNKKFSENYKKDIIIFFAFGIVSLIMSVKIFPFEYLPDTLKMLQFTWRMHEFSSFFLSIVSGISIGYFVKNNRNNLFFSSIIIILSWLLLMLNINCYTSEAFNEDKYLIPRPVTSNTGRVHAGCATFEYLPKKAFQNRSYIEQRQNEVIILEGSANIVNMNKENSKLSFDIEQVKDNTKLELPYIYYLGYNVKAIEKNGDITNVKIEESDNGFCVITVNSNVARIEVSYDGTTLMKLSYALTSIGITLLIWKICRELHNVI